jgi:hypothetical protein
MKIFSNKLVLEVLMLLCSLHLVQTKFVKKSAVHLTEQKGFHWINIRNKGDRKLAGDEDQKQVNMVAFKMAMSELIKKEIGARFGGDNISGSEDSLVVKNPSGKGNLFKVNIEQKDDEILELPMVQVTLQLEMITYTFALEKTPIRGAPERKCQLIMNNFFFIAEQYISEIGDIKGDLGAALALVLPQHPGGNEASGGNERLLREVKRRQDSLIQSLPIQSHIRVYPLDLKNKKYISVNEKHQQGIDNAIKTLKQKDARRLVGRELKSKDDLPQELTVADPKYLVNKRKIYHQHKLDSDIFLQLILTDGINGGDEDSPDELTMRLSPSEGELGEIRVSFKKVHTGILIYMSHPSMTWTFLLSFPTKRFVLLHFLKYLFDVERDFKIIHNLNHLQSWKDNGNDHMAKQRIIRELIQPTMLYFLFRQEFDNRTAGITETSNGFDGDIIQYMHTEKLNEDTWWMKIFDVQSKPRRELLFDNITFNEFGEGFLVCYYESTIYVNDKSLKLGLRQFPDESMFNQHYLAVKYIDMQAEFVTRMMHLKVPSDYITPFPVRSLIYPSQDAIPEMNDDLRTAKKLHTVLDLVNSPPIQNFDDMVKYETKLCPIVSIEFDDSIKLSTTSNGQSLGYRFEMGNRSNYRWLADFCSYPVPLAGGEGERRLNDEDMEGFLV